MNALRNHLNLVSLKPLFVCASNLAHAELAIERQAKAATNARDIRAGADMRLADLDLDGFLSFQLDAMKHSGHWARITRFNSTGNHSAVIEYIPTAGEIPESVFGPHDYGNTVSLQVWACHDGQVRIEVYSRRNRMSLITLPPDKVTRQTLDGAFADFVRLAVRHAEKTATRH